MAFHLGSLEVRWYGILLALGFLLAYYTLQKIFKTEGLSQKQLDKISIWTIVWTIVGLRLGHFLFYEPEMFVTHPLQILLPFDENWHFIGYQGLASHGGVLGIFGFLIYYCLRYKVNFLWLLDRLGIAVPVAASLVRVGNLMNHEIVGRITEVPWAFDFIYGGFGVAGTFRHPAQLYEAAEVDGANKWQKILLQGGAGAGRGWPRAQQWPMAVHSDDYHRVGMSDILVCETFLSGVPV